MSGQATSPAIDVRVLAEVETMAAGSDPSMRKLVPADRVSPGDQVIYTLQIRNGGPFSLRAPSIVRPVPEHMKYLAGSAAGPGAQISFSVDGGRRFGQLETLELREADGRLRAATAADVTHIRWQLKGTLQPDSIAFARFRALVK